MATNPCIGDILLASLEAAVPLAWYDIVRHWSLNRRVEFCHKAADFIAEHGDIIMYRGKKKGESAEAFNTLAKALAVLASMPGGVKFSNLRFIAEGEHIKVTKV